MAASVATGSPSSRYASIAPCAYGLRSRAATAGRLRRPVEQRRALGRIGRDRQRLVEIGDGLVVATECGRPVGRAGESEARLGRDRIGLRTRIRGLAGGEVMAGQRAGQLIVAERFVVPRHGEVPRASIAAGKGAVRDLADQGLHELVLPALRRLRIALDIEQLSSGEVAEPRLELLGGDAADGRERIGREDLADDRGVLEQRPIRGVEPVEPRGDQ